MLMNGTISTKGFVGKTIQAAVKLFGQRAHSARWGEFRPQTFLPDELISEFLTELNPLLKVALCDRVLIW